MKLSLVIPVFNEAPNVRPLYDALVASTQPLGMDAEMLFIDDGSTDDSLAQLKALHAADPRVKIVSLSRNFGHQKALTAGLDHAAGDVVVTLDADLQHPPSLIADLLARWREGAKIVIGLRQTNRWTPKQITSRAFYALFRCFTGVYLPANAADFRLLDAAVVRTLRHMPERTRFLRGLTAWTGYPVRYVSYVETERRRGETKYGYWRMLRLAVDGMVSFSTAPLYAALFLGFGLSLLGILEIVYAIYTRFISERALPGWTSTIIWISLIGGIQLLVMGTTGFYIAKIYEEVKQRPLYVVQEKIG